ncbi:MAG: prepilin-type N-terminal cleavage/methylation domain-containing protein [Patescibacteria group bacterium]
MIKQKSRPGFSLIEILVSITILAIMSTVGIASYRNTARNQALLADVDQIIQVLNIAKTNVSSGKKISCGNLAAWQVSFLGSSYKLQEVCTVGLPQDYAIYNLGSKNTTNIISISFYSLGKGATAGTITLSPANKIINVSISGNIQ